MLRTTVRIMFLSFIIVFAQFVSVLAEKINFKVLATFCYDSTGNPQAQILIAGGYADGIEIGQTGPVYHTGRRRKKIADLEIVDVSEHESAAIATSRKRKVFVRRGDQATIDLPELDLQQMLDKGEWYLEVGKCGQAYSYFERYLEQVPDDSAALAKINDCKLGLEHERTRSLTEEEIKAESELIPAYLFFASQLLAEFDTESAKRYLDRILRADPTHRKARELEAICRKDLERGNPAPDDFVPVDVFPVMIYEEKPDYPRLAKQKGIQGTVWIKALINEEGKVIDAIIGKSSGNQAIDQSALAAAPKNKFSPGKQKGKPTKVWVNYKVDFILH